MGVERLPARYAHSCGHTDVCYSENGEKLITCGTDGDIRIWSGFEDYDPVQTCVGEWSLCVRQKNNHIQIGTDNNNVQLLTFPNGERDGILTRFTAQVNHMAVGRNHNLIALVAEDMAVKIINLVDTKESSSHLVFSGLSGPPLSVALCPKGKLICVSSGDGYIRIWNVETQTLLKELCCVPKTNSFTNAKLLCRMDFDAISGKYLAYPEGSTIIILSTEDWSIYKRLGTRDVTVSFSIVQFSPCSKFLAATSEVGDVVIWEVPSETVINCSTSNSPIAISAMVWNPLGNGEIAFCDVQGQLGILLNCNKSSQEIPTANDEKDDANIDFGDVEFEHDEDGEDDAVSLEKFKESPKSETELQFDRDSSAHHTRARTPEIPLQASFMPSSTPEHLNPRFLCWNEIGIVKSYGTPEDQPRSIEVEFHDTTFHSSMMMQNFSNYTMASLSSSILAVANAKQVTVVPLTPGIREWSLNVDEDKDIVCIAASNKIVCFSTSNYLVHICTAYGTQRSVISVPGPIVCMSAKEGVLLIAYHGSAPRKDDQCFKMMLVRFEGMSVINKYMPCALTPDTSLSWIGFTDVGTPSCYDSSGMLYLFPLSSNIWLPFCDTNRYSANGIIDGFFITAIFESRQVLRGIRCKGSDYPRFAPRPIQLELPLEPPFVEASTEKSQMEANLYAWRLLQAKDTDRKFIETGLKTFVLACKNNLDQRALELMELLENQQVLSLALKYATKLDKKRLAGKLTDLISQTNSSNDNPSSQESPSCKTPRPPLKLNKRLVLNSNSKLTPKSKSFSVQDDKSKEEASTSRSFIESPALNNVSGISMNTQESLFAEEEPKNPFLKGLKQSKPVVHNPLSLTDKFAGFNVDKKENKPANEIVEKRKQPDTSADSDKQKEKQRKLDMFRFSKNN